MQKDKGQRPFEYSPYLLGYLENFQEWQNWSEVTNSWIGGENMQTFCICRITFLAVIRLYIIYKCKEGD